MCHHLNHLSHQLLRAAHTIDALQDAFFGNVRHDYFSFCKPSCINSTANASIDLNA